VVFASTASCFLGCLQAEEHGQLKNSKVLRSLQHDCSFALSFVRFRLASLDTDFFLLSNAGTFFFFSFVEYSWFFCKYYI